MFWTPRSSTRSTRATGPGGKAAVWTAGSFAEQAAARSTTPCSASAGALISQTCADATARDVKFCGNGTQLLLRDPTNGEENDSSKNNGNPDQIMWNRSASISCRAGRPTSVVGAVDAGRHGSWIVLSTAKGALEQRAARCPARQLGSTDSRPPRDGDLIWFGGTTYALPAARSAFRWQAETARCPRWPTRRGCARPGASRRSRCPPRPASPSLDPGDRHAEPAFAVGAAAAGSRSTRSAPASSWPAATRRSTGDASSRSTAPSGSRS